MDEEVWVSIFQVRQIRSPLRATFEKYKKDLPKSLMENKYQYSVGFMTVPSSASNDYGTRDRKEVLEDQEGSRFLEPSFSLLLS